MKPIEYNPERVLEYVKCMEKHNRAIEIYDEIVRKNNRSLTTTINKYIDRSISTMNIGKDVINIDTKDKERLEEIAKNILNSVKQHDKQYEDIGGLNIEIDYNKGIVLFKPKKVYRVVIYTIPKSKYYGKKRNKMINTYHKY